MKINKALLLLLLACFVILVGCRGQVAELPTTEPSETEKMEIVTSDPYFTGKVLEKYDGSCLMEVTGAGSGLMVEGQEVVVHMNIPDCPDYAVGDFLTIQFDGKMTCSLPPQIVGVAILDQNG